MRTSPLSLLAIVLTSLALPAQTPLRNMPGPQGGQIIYGTVDGANTPPAAMGFILRQLHQKYGERPQVGRVFRVRGTESNAVFFTLTPHNPGMGKVAGMLLTANAPGHVEAALLSDDAARFGTSINPMMQKLFSVWQPGGKSLSTSAPAQGDRPSAESSGPVAPMHPYRLPDNSASMMLAEGWRVLPISSHGNLVAQGPRGEVLALGFGYVAHDTNNPATARGRAFANSPAGRNTSYARNIYAPYGAELGRTFMELNAQSQRVGGPAVPPVQLEKVQPIQARGARCAILTGTSSAGGVSKQMEGTFCQAQPDSSGTFTNIANLAFVPTELAARERSTVHAMLSSFQINQAVFDAQENAAAAPGIEAIHQIGRDVNARIAVSDQQNAQIKSSFEQHNDVMDRTSQGFSNYILDKSVIRDTETGAHATTWDTTAQTIVNSNPQRYEFVTTPNYWKGIDY
jgi:hypothetical protein